MIRIFYGNVGSGKTACAVRELYNNKTKKNTYSNIITKRLKNNILLKKDMIIKKKIVKVKQNNEAVYKYELNKEYWQDLIKKEKGINIILDEIHTLLNARRSTSEINKIMTDFLALMRRILGSADSGNSTLTLITQLERRIDIIAKEMCNHVRYHICHYIKTCDKCGYNKYENNEISDQMLYCHKCKNPNITKHSHVIVVYYFKSNDMFIAWKYYGKKSYYKKMIINDIEKYFKYYDTLQWENLITEF